MRKIRLSDTDVELFDMEILPSDFLFYQKHKDAFRTMWKEQGKPFWTRFAITFRSFTVKHGVIQQMSIDSPKFENLIDQAFIFIHEQYVDGKENMAKNFLEDVAKLAQNQDKFPALDSKSFARDPFYVKETRELFRRFFGMPDQKSSYLKVYILCPIYMRFGGSVCRCLVRWLDAPPHDPRDDSYWLQPQRTVQDKPEQTQQCCASHALMCSNCLDDCGTKYFRERICGVANGPKFLDYWDLGDPRFNDEKNPLFAPTSDPSLDWRNDLTVDMFRDFLHYAKFKYGTDVDKCKECIALKRKQEEMTCPSGHKAEKKKRKQKKKDQEELQEFREIRRQLNEVDLSGDDMTPEELSEKLMDLVKGKTTPQDALKEVMTDLQRKKALKEMNEPRSPKKENKKRQKAQQLRDKVLQSGSERKDIFSPTAKVTEDFKYGILSGNETEANKKVVGGFKVVKIDDKKNGFYEATITIAAVKGEEEEEEKSLNLVPSNKSKQKRNQYVLSAELIQNKIELMPKQLEWHEGIGWCAAVVNYAEEEKDLCSKPTNFTIKVSGYDEDTIKRTMFKLLLYVAKRKKRPSLGWMMDDDDVVACILPDDCPHQEGLTITIIHGFRFEERLTKHELKTIQKQGVAISRRLLMSLSRTVAADIMAEDGGHEKMKMILAKISAECAEGEEEQMKYDFTSKKESIDRTPKKGISVEKIGETELWKQMVVQPDRFELFVMVSLKREEEFRSYGLKKVDLDYYMDDGKPVLLCRTCKMERLQCICCEHVSSFPDKQQATDTGTNTVAYRVPQLKIEDFYAGLLTEMEKIAQKDKGQGKDVTCCSSDATKSQPSPESTDLSAERLSSDGKNNKQNLYSVPKSDANPVISEDSLKDANTNTATDDTSVSSPPNLTPRPLPVYLRPPPAKPGQGKTVTLAIPGDEPNTLKTIQVNPETLPPEVVQDLDMDNGCSFLARIDPNLPAGPQLANKTISVKVKTFHENVSIKLGPFVPEEKIKEMQLKKEQRLKEGQKQKEAGSVPVDKEMDKKILELMYLKTIKDAEEKKSPRESDGSQKVKVTENIPEQKSSKKTELDTQKKKSESRQKSESSVEADTTGSSVDVSMEQSVRDTIVHTDSHPSLSDSSVQPENERLIELSKLTRAVAVAQEHMQKSKEEKEAECGKVITDINELPPKDRYIVTKLLNEQRRDRELYEAQRQKQLENLIPSKDRNEIQRAKLRKKVHGTPIDMFDEVTMESVVNKEKKKKSKEADLKNQLKTCAGCGKVEPDRKSFKKCQKCKEEGWVDARYYCGRDCQVSDWKACHKKEHREKFQS